MQGKSIAILEVKSFAAAIHALDQMLKAAQVHVVHCEKKLGSRLVTVIVDGDASSVQAALAAGIAAAGQIGKVVAAEVIVKPHPEIAKFIYKPKSEQAKRKSKSKAKKTGGKKDEPGMLGNG